MDGMLFTFVGILLILNIQSFTLKNAMQTFSLKMSSNYGIMKPRINEGRIVVTGIGSNEEDEFMLNLLNEQNAWHSVVLAAEDSNILQKRFLSRTARYSGLLNLLEFASVDLSNMTQVNNLLNNANAWIAFSANENTIPQWTESAIQNGLSRLIFTVELPPHRINETSIPAFESAITMCETAGNFTKFTGIRHGTIIPGDEDNPYEIVNATIPCLENKIESGVLSRVTAELLRIDDSLNTYCGIGSSGGFAGAYLTILRQSGLTRTQEVRKIFNGGIQRVARLTVARYEKDRKEIEEKKNQMGKRQMVDETEDESDYSALSRRVKKFGDQFDEDIDDNELFSEEQLIEQRTEEILAGVWKEYNGRMYTKFTTKEKFLIDNRQKAYTLALKEFEEDKKVQQQLELEKEAQTLMVDKVQEATQKRYAKLLALEKKEMENQKQQSDIWVKYIYLLLETTMDYCTKSEILFHNLDEFQQTMLLRDMANELRKLCKLPAYEVVYDPLDAQVIVTKLSSTDRGKELSLDGNVDVISKLLNVKYGTLLKSVAALRGAAQIIALAIETLRKELPKPPPTIAEMRRNESLTKQQSMTQIRLETLKNRGKPFSPDEATVGKM